MMNSVNDNNYHETASTIVGIIAAYKSIPAEEITLDTSLDSIGLNSLDALTIAFEVEETFGIAIDEGELISLKTISDIVRRVDEIRKKD